ncbi:hypothetical protein ACFO0U_09145 [Chromohalobacter sarecensis]|uniref:Uncharacterized protein n=1 Tax=Chromohalobacter sarecensis TaxID=245294 RepID=A0ABV9D1J4_9GAMM|nr:hypothetical protein [Chromohalobacter sarecensis]MCK0716431.1 hypothetical protein [Chromohalobacter sarecensis]
MPETSFYAKAMRGTPRLVRRWLMLGQAAPDRLAMILADTSRLAGLGEPESEPDGHCLREWSGERQPPLWAARTAVFLLVQMPARPTPDDDEEACAWAYCWLRNREFDSLEAAHDALPSHLRDPLAAALDAAWVDQNALRLI